MRLIRRALHHERTQPAGRLRTSRAKRKRSGERTTNERRRIRGSAPEALARASPAPQRELPRWLLSRSLSCRTRPTRSCCARCAPQPRAAVALPLRLPGKARPLRARLWAAGRRLLRGCSACHGRAVGRARALRRGRALGPAARPNPHSNCAPRGAAAWPPRRPRGPALAGGALCAGLPRCCPASIAAERFSDATRPRRLHPVALRSLALPRPSSCTRFPPPWAWTTI